MRTDLIDAAAEGAIERAAGILRSGGLVAFPTETVYGLGALGLDPNAVERIFEAKRRPHADPLILHVADLDMARPLVRELPERAQRLARAFWPGALTLVLPKSAAVPDRVTAGLDSVAVRAPAHPVALSLIRAVGAPLAAPSANLFGRTSPTMAEHDLHDLEGSIDAVLDAGPTPLGLESTVLDIRGPAPVIFRPGGVSREDLEKALGEPVHLHGYPAAPLASPLSPLSSAPALASPGLLAKHYSPQAEVRLFAGEDAAVIAAIRGLAENTLDPGALVILGYTEDLLGLEGLQVPVLHLGSRRRLDKVAHGLYAALRAADERGASVIAVRTVPQGGLGDAINDRLLRAASSRVEQV